MSDEIEVEPKSTPKPDTSREATALIKMVQFLELGLGRGAIWSFAEATEIISAIRVFQRRDDTEDSSARMKLEVDALNRLIAYLEAGLKRGAYRSFSEVDQVIEHIKVFGKKG